MQKLNLAGDIILTGKLYNPRTFYNLPIPAHRSEMLRRALIDLAHAGIEVNALMHDGIL